jgi:hypothetical protein
MLLQLNFLSGGEAERLYKPSLDVVATEISTIPADEHHLVHEPIVGRAKASLKHMSAYLCDIATNNDNNQKTGTLACSIVYGREWLVVEGIEPLLLRPMKEGGFKVSIKLPFLTVQTIKNPLYSPTMGNYLRKEWMKKTALWSRGIVEVVEHAKEMEIEDNNQFSEALFGMVKHNQKVHTYCSEPAEYVSHRWDDTVKSNRVFVDQVQTLEESISAVDRRREAKAARASVAMTQDALTQQEEEQEDEVWTRLGSTVESETSLRNELKSFFQEKDLSNTNMNECHKFFAKHFARHHHNMKIMSYSTFNSFMTGTRTNPLKKLQKQQLEMLLISHP